MSKEQDSPGTGKPRPGSVFRAVVVRGLVVLAIVLGLSALSTAALFQQAARQTELSREELPRLVTAVRLYSNATTLSGLSTRALTVETRTELRTLRDRILDRAEAIEQDVRLLESLGLPADRVARLRGIQGDYLQTASSLNALMQEILRLRADGSEPQRLATLNARRTGLMQRQELLGSEMTTLMMGITHEIEAELLAQQSRTRELGRGLVIALAAGSLAAGLGVLNIYAGLRRLVLDRLQRLTDALRDWRAGQRPTLGRDGYGDEISEMTDTLDDLIQMVDARTQELTAQAETDPLTGLLNRRGFEDRGITELHRAQRYGTPVSVLVGDIDHFKQVNDSRGHAVGDEALRVVAERWQEVLRDVDVCARLGGEEFAALLPHTSLSEALVVAERIRERVRSSPIASDPAQDAGAFTITISLGVAELQGDPDLDALLARADDALYQAKRNGRDRVVGDLIDGDQAAALG